jgi:hypothetical protein
MHTNLENVISNSRQGVQIHETKIINKKKVNLEINPDCQQFKVKRIINIPTSKYLLSAQIVICLISAMII